MESEDKIIGGYISIRQFLWLMIPVITLIGSFVLNKNYIVRTDKGINISVINIAWRIILFILLLVNSIIMAFIKIKGENSDIYLINRIKYSVRSHVYM